MKKYMGAVMSVLFGVSLLGACSSQKDPLEARPSNPSMPSAEKMPGKSEFYRAATGCGVEKTIGDSSQPITIEPLGKGEAMRIVVGEKREGKMMLTKNDAQCIIKLLGADEKTAKRAMEDANGIGGAEYFGTNYVVMSIKEKRGPTLTVANRKDVQDWNKEVNKAS
ncbi:hypothetical protein R6G85_05775 [Actinotignum urinale]|nr:hypothetical protein [Actinotignum urinale]MDY5151986.1 hypothetical protein [Actinotignum urinale]WIK59132.1 hypothetical protein CJ184_000200 [Actinotignum urinale]